MIDLRSDTITRPDRGMRQAMANAEVGDDVFGEDPTVNRLQEKIAELIGKEAALFVPSGTMGNQISVNVHTVPGDEVICDVHSHVVNFEGGAMAFLSGVQPRTLEGKRGIITAEQVRCALRPRASHFPRSRLVVLENTHNLAGGTVYPIAEIEKIHTLARKNDLRLHLDGARLWNACIASGLTPADYAKYFDSVSVCLSKGLGAPAGSVVAGSEEFIHTAHRYRKQFGGGMRQVGVLAAAGLYALEHNYQRLNEDHENARAFAEVVAAAGNVQVDLASVQTNIVILDLPAGHSAGAMCDELRRHGVLLVPMGERKLRAVTHLDVSKKDVHRAAEIVAKVLSV